MVDDEIIIPEIEPATEHYCDNVNNNCEDLPATQLLKIKVIISIIIEKYKFGLKSKQFLKKLLRFWKYPIPYISLRGRKPFQGFYLKQNLPIWIKAARTISWIHSHNCGSFKLNT